MAYWSVLFKIISRKGRKLRLKAYTSTFNSNVSDIKSYIIILSSVEPRRLLPGDHPRELYVCHHQSVPQSVVELAFKLGFGV